MIKSWQIFALAALACPAAHGASIYGDNFDDGFIGPQWTPVIDSPKLTLSETGGRLNVLSAASDNKLNDALYFSTFRLSTAANFTITADYSFAAFTLPTPQQPGGTAPIRSMAVVFGIGQDADGQNSAAIGQGFVSIRNPFTGAISTQSAEVVGYRTNDAESFLTPTLPPPNGIATGQFEISYDAAFDDLTLREIGGATYTLADTVRGIWHAADLFVSLGGRGDSEFSTVSGQAYLDNFTIVQGVTVVPEPAGLILLAASGVLLRRRR